MTRGARLLGFLLAAAAAPSLVAACTSSSRGGATVFGRVQDEAGEPVDGALVALDGRSVAAASDGTFTFDARPGTSTLDVSASGFRRVTVDLKLGEGDNVVEITLVVCTPGVDAGCEGTPTPTPSPSPSPTPNVAAVFDGANANLDGGQFFGWTGQATLTAPTEPVLTLGDDAESFLMGGSDLAFNECWDDAAEMDTYDGVGTPDHCVFWFDGENEAYDGTDAVFYVRIPGVLYTAGNTITFDDGMTAGYYQGNLAAGGVRILNYTLVHPAVSGTLTIGDAGTTGGTASSITGTATFYIPTLP